MTAFASLAIANVKADGWVPQTPRNAPHTQELPKNSLNGIFRGGSPTSGQKTGQNHTYSPHSVSNGRVKANSAQ